MPCVVGHGGTMSDTCQICGRTLVSAAKSPIRSNECIGPRGKGLICYRLGWEHERATRGKLEATLREICLVPHERGGRFGEDIDSVRCRFCGIVSKTGSMDAPPDPYPHEKNCVAGVRAAPPSSPSPHPPAGEE